MSEEENETKIEVQEGEPETNKNLLKILSSKEEIEKEVEHLKTNIESYLFDIPKLLSKIEEIIEKLLPENFLGPLATLLKLAKSIPIKKMIQFTKQGLQSLEEFENGVKDGDLMVDLDLNGMELAEDILGNEKLLPALENFSNLFKKLFKTFLKFIPIDLFKIIYELRDKLKIMVLNTYVDAMKKVSPFVEGTKELMEHAVELLNPIELFTVYFDHMDQNKDGELSLEEILDIGASLEFFQEQHLEKTELMEKIMKDSSKLVNLAKNFELKDEILSIIHSLDFSFVSELFKKILEIIKNFAVEQFEDFIDCCKTFASFFLDPQNLIGTVMNPEEGRLMTHLFDSFPLFKELKEMFNFHTIIEDSKSMLELFTNKELFKLNFMVSLDEGKDAIKTLIDEMIKLFHTIKDFIIHAMQRSRQMFQSGELKDKFKDLLDEDGDGKVEVSDVLTGFSKIGGKLLDQDGDGDFDSKDALNALGNGFGGLLDQDGDGDLDLQDVKRFAVSQFDTDGDGDLDFKDVLNSFKKSNLDSDGDGKVDAKDVMLKFKSIGTSLFDQDGDGKLDAKDVMKGAGKFFGGLFKKKK